MHHKNTIMIHQMLQEKTFWQANLTVFHETDCFFRWHTMDGPSWKEKEHPSYGAHNTQEYDEQHGRWWWQKKDQVIG
jgi:hypothetical protein